MNKQVRLGNIYNEASGTGFAGNVWDVKGVSPTLTCMGNGGGQTTNDHCFVCCASRGRRNNKENWQQQLEINTTDTSNAITSVEKDNYILEINYAKQ